MTFFSCIYTKISLLIGILIVVYLLPIWLFDYFPTQDGVSHVYNSQIITEYSNQTYQFRDYYDINWFPFPNWLSHISLTLLMFIFPSLTAEKVFLSLYIILFPLAIRYFLNIELTPMVRLGNRTYRPENKTNPVNWVLVVRIKFNNFRAGLNSQYYDCS